MSKTGESGWKQVKMCENVWNWVKHLKTGEMDDKEVKNMKTCGNNQKWAKKDENRWKWVKQGQIGENGWIGWKQVKMSQSR